MSATTSASDRPLARDSDRPNPTSKSPEQEHSRRDQVLTKTAAAAVESIADAVVIKADEPFFLCPPDGRIPLHDRHGYGLYYHDTRFLSGYELAIADAAPISLAASATAGTRATLELTTPDVVVGRTRVATQRLAVRWVRELDGDRLELRDEIAIHNYTSTALTLPISLRFAATFEDIFRVRGLLAEQPGRLHRPAWKQGALRHQFDGEDGVTRTLTVHVDPKPTHPTKGGCDLDLEVAARGTARIAVRLRIGERVAKGAAPMERRGSRSTRPPSQAARREEGRGDDSWAGGGDWQTAIRTGSIGMDAVLARSLDDLSTLRADLDGLRYYAAGIPWFVTLFGRDSLIAAYQTLPFDSGVAADTLRLLAGRQGTQVDFWRDEEPGKIMHELRMGELARLDRIPQTPYYGSIDATPLFLIVLARHAAWTGRLDLFHELETNVQRALAWMAAACETPGNGYLAYDSFKNDALVNQGWKDSGNAIVAADGEIATPPIALAEVQGYVYRAKHDIADLYERDGETGRADRLRVEADALRDRFERDFWSARLGCYVLARHAGDRRCEVVTSNAGQVLWSGIASADHAATVAERLGREDMFSGWGIRTLSAKAKAFWPLGYHLGTVWPHDNSLIAEGFRRYGLDEQADRILVALVETALHYPHDRLPECLAGYARRDFGLPVRYPVACHPQAWAAGAVPHLALVNLGLEADGFARRLRVTRPRLPSFVDHLELRGLPVGEARVDLEFRRAGAAVSVAVTKVAGDLAVDVAEA
jgi:glycogen debranching enzyme